jgi:hypothetical protein
MFLSLSVYLDEEIRSWQYVLCFDMEEAWRDLRISKKEK